jgi:hypothetical protein
MSLNVQAANVYLKAERTGGKLPQGRRGRGSACGGDGIILERVLAVGGRPLPGHKLSDMGSSIE